MLRINLRLQVLVLFLWVLPVAAQKVETGFLDRSVILNGEEFRYQVYVPREFRSAVKWPVILTLHGGGSYGSDGIRQTSGDGGVAGSFAAIPNAYPLLLYFRRLMGTGLLAGSEPAD